MSRAPVVLFTYNRPSHTRATIEALKANVDACDTHLRIYSDGAKDARQADAVRQVREYLRGIDGFASVAVVERERNMGLAASVIAGVSEMLDENASVIVMEDDLVVAPAFLKFMNAALETYAARPDVFSVTGYNYPLPIRPEYPEAAYLSYRSSSWGWATWSDRWRKVDWLVSDFATFIQDAGERARFARGGADLLPMLKRQLAGELDSWAIRFAYAHYKHDAFCVHPIRSKLRNIGFDGSGVHCGISDSYDVEVDSSDVQLRADLQVDPAILKIFDERFRSAPSPAVRIRSLVRLGLRKIAQAVGSA